jgi:hypothetical protein
MTSEELKEEIDLAITTETTPASITPTDVGDTLKLMVDYVDQEVSKDKRLTLKLLQSGTSDPTVVTEMKADIAYFVNRAGVGNYQVNSTGSLFLEAKTIPFITNINQSIGGSTVNIFRVNDNYCRINTRDSAGNLADGILNNYIVDITILA